MPSGSITNTLSLTLVVLALFIFAIAVTENLKYREFDVKILLDTS